MNDASDRELSSNIKRLGDILEKESSSSLKLIKEVLANLNENNLIGFFDIFLREEKRDGWKKYNVKSIVEKLDNIGMVKDPAVKSSISNSSEMSLFLVMSALERVAEHLEAFTQTFLRSFWGTEDNLCANCGNKNSSDSLYCNQCGNEMESASWDASLNKITAEVGIQLMHKLSNKAYYLKSEDSMLYGCFYKNGLINNEEKFLVGSLKSMGINITVLDDRIYFEKKGMSNNVVSTELERSIQGIAKDLKFHAI